MKGSVEETSVTKEHSLENYQSPARIDFTNNNGDNLSREANVSNCGRSSVCCSAYPRNVLLQYADAEQFDGFDITRMLGRQCAL